MEDNQKQKPIICLMGPTASGKTQLAVQLVQQFPLEIVSVDSAMVYRGMDIGTAKPDAAILKIAPHWLINLRDPAEPYSAAQFCIDAHAAIQDIHARNKIPLLVGGTMLYFRALLKGFSDLPSADADFRAQLIAEANHLGWPALHARLQSIDPIVAARIHPNDSQRIQRALEVIQLSGKSFSSMQNHNQFWLKNNKIIVFGLVPRDRKILHQRIAYRFRQMLKMGLIDEVAVLFARGDLTPELPAIRAAGYHQVWDYLAGNMSLIEMEERAIIATRQLAKRQLTWLRHWSPVDAWFECEALNIFDQLIKQIEVIL